MSAFTLAISSPITSLQIDRQISLVKLEVVKQEVARVNIDILGISELKWTGMGKLNSDDHYIYYFGQESLRGMQYPSQSTKDFTVQCLDATSTTTE